MTRLTFIALVVTFVACSSTLPTSPTPTADVPTIRVTISVIDLHERPIPYASITVDNGHFADTRMSDSQGRLTVKAYTGEAFTLKVSATGYVPFSTTTVLTATTYSYWRVYLNPVG